MMSNAIERLRHAVRTLPGVLARFSEAESEERSSPERWTKKVFRRTGGRRSCVGGRGPGVD